MKIFDFAVKTSFGQSCMTICTFDGEKSFDKLMEIFDFSVKASFGQLCVTVCTFPARRTPTSCL